jgi:hypothetical protein
MLIFPYILHAMTINVCHNDNKATITPQTYFAVTMEPDSTNI